MLTPQLTISDTRKTLVIKPTAFWIAIKKNMSCEQLSDMSI